MTWLYVGAYLPMVGVAVNQITMPECRGIEAITVALVPQSMETIHGALVIHIHRSNTVVLPLVR